jgi:hypothetical protein
MPAPVGVRVIALPSRDKAATPRRPTTGRAEASRPPGNGAAPVLRNRCARCQRGVWQLGRGRRRVLLAGFARSAHHCSAGRRALSVSARGVYAALAFSIGKRFSLVLWCGRDGRLTALFGGFRPGRVVRRSGGWRKRMGAGQPRRAVPR